MNFLTKWATKTLAEKKADKGQRGNVDIGGVLLMGIAMVFLAVGFIVFPIVTDATDSLLAYNYSANGTGITDATFTGFTAVVGVTPLLVLIGYLTASVFTMFLGVKVVRGEGGGSGGVNMGALILLAISMIFIAIGLIILPVALDGIASVMASRAEVTDTNTSVDTAVGVTTANYTLTQRLYNNDTAEVVSVSSNVSADAPITIDSYSYPNLYLSSVTANTTGRTMTTVYDYNDQLSTYSGLYSILAVTPLLILISFLAGTVITGYFGIKKLGAND